MWPNLKMTKLFVTLHHAGCTKRFKKKASENLAECCHLVHHYQLACKMKDREFLVMKKSLGFAAPFCK